MDSSLHALARSQSGLISTRQLSAQGLSWHDFQVLAAAEGWRRVGRGIYLMPGVELTLLVQHRACQLRHRELVASGASGAVLCGLTGLPEEFEATAPAGVRWDVPGLLRRGLVPPEDVMLVEGVRVTTPLRTVVDLLLTRPAWESVPVLDQALRHGRVSLQEVAERLSTLESYRGIKRAWRSFRLADPKAESVLESRTRLRFNAAGHFPVSQVRILLPSREVRVDLVIGITSTGELTRDVRRAAQLLLIEPEGKKYHSDDERHDADVARFNDVSELADISLALRVTCADAHSRHHAMIRLAESRLTLLRRRVLGARERPTA